MKKQLLSMGCISLLILCACDKLPVHNVHSELQEKYLSDAYTNYSAYVNGQEEKSIPNAYSIQLDGVEVGSIIKTYEDEKLFDSYEYKVSSPTYDLYNFKLGTKYKTEIVSSDNVVKTYEFKTSDVAPRNLYIEGVTNCRDLGGWKIDKRHRVKQGMIYRTSKYNDDESTNLLITDKGINVLKNVLGVKSEIDLRKTSDNENGGLTVSPLGSSVNYISYPMVSSGNVMTLNKTKLKGIFDYFANKDNYPIAFHCSIGTDRTGLIAFLINGLLGVGEEDLYRDYLFSNFGMIYNMRTAKTIDEYLENINMFDGKTLSERFESYLLNAGVSSSSIDTIKEIMIEKI